MEGNYGEYLIMLVYGFI